jgi:hypothetical protein
VNADRDHLPEVGGNVIDMNVVLHVADDEVAEDGATRSVVLAPMQSYVRVCRPGSRTQRCSSRTAAASVRRLPRRAIARLSLPDPPGRIVREVIVSKRRPPTFLVIVGNKTPILAFLKICRKNHFVGDLEDFNFFHCEIQ